MLTATIVFLPLRTAIPTLAGLSAGYLMFAVLLGYILLHRPKILDRTWRHPVFLAGYGLLILSALIEFAHTNSGYVYLSRIGGTIVGAVLVATLCRDREALRAGVYGYLIAGAWMSVLALVTSYSALRSATPTGFAEATSLRDAVFMGSPLIIDLNEMAFITAQAAVVALALVLTAGSAIRRNLLLGILILCLVATFLPMSRGGLVIAGASFGMVIWAYGVTRVRSIVTPIIVAVVLLISIPGGVLSRLTYSTETRVDIRARVYDAAIKAFPEYVFTGVGAGNFESWGMRNGLGYLVGPRSARFMGFSREDFTPGVYVLGAHNCFLQVTIIWGIAALVALLAVVYQAYRCVPKRCGTDVLALCLYGIAVSSLLRMMVVHVFEKQFSLALGLLVGSQLWIWTRREVGHRRDATPASS